MPGLGSRLLRAPQSARLASRENWRAGARGAARGEATYRTPAPRRSRALPARAPRRTSASSRRALSQSPNTLRSGSCRRPGARGASTIGRGEPLFLAPGHPTVINRCPAKVCPIPCLRSLVSTRGVARLRAGACIEVRGRSAPGARVVGVGRARFAARCVAQGTNPRPRPPVPPRCPNYHPPPRRATHVQRARAD